MHPLRSVWSIISRQTTRIINLAFGSFSWKPPTWPVNILKYLKIHQYQAAVLAVVVVGLLIGGYQGYNWYLHLPKPVEVDWHIAVPTILPPLNENQKANLVLTFDRSVARLDLIGKEIKEGIKLTPEIPGKWRWSNGSYLTFEPSVVWPADTEYEIDLKPSLFSPLQRIERPRRTFQTLPFTVQITEPIFYVNPKDPTEKAITATLTFSHPVDHDSLERSVRLEMQGKEEIFLDKTGLPSHFTYTYDPKMNERVVYLHSAPIKPPQQAGYARLTVPTDVLTTLGHKYLSEPEQTDIRVPSLYNLFRIDQSELVITRDANNNPGQALILSTSVGVKDAELAGAVHAYMLPLYKKIKVEKGEAPYEWNSPAEIDKDILKRSVSIKLTLVPSEEDFSSVHSFKLEMPEHRYAYVVVNKGIQSLGNFVLKESFDSVCVAPNYPREVKIMHEGSLLALTGERKLSISSRGVEELEYRLARVTAGQINHLVSQTQGAFPNMQFLNSYYFDENNIAEIITRRDSVLLKDNSEANYSALDFSEFVKDPEKNRGKLGLFFLNVFARKAGSEAGYYKTNGDVITDAASAEQQKNDPERNYPQDNGDVLSDRRLILVTDLGLIIKDNADETHDVFVQSIKTGQPVEDAVVDVLGKNGVPITTTKTDGQGHASIPSVSGFVREQRPVAYVVHRDEDVSFLPFGREDRELNFSRFDTSGLTGMKPEDLLAFVFTDRGIYRPGDEAKLGFIVKQRNWKGSLNGIPLLMEITDPKDQVVQSRTLKLNATGFIESTFKTEETSLTGNYRVNIYLVKDGSEHVLLGSENFKVKEFLPDRLKITARLVPTPVGWTPLDNLQQQVQLQNLYGAPAVGHRMTAKLSFTPSSFYFDKYPDYTFADPYANDHEKSREMDLPEQKTDDAGTVNFDLKQPDMDPYAMQLSVLTEGFEKEGGRSVKAYNGALISPRAWLLGVKTDGNFSFLKKNSQHVVKMMAVNNKLDKIEASDLTVHLIEVRYVSSLVKKDNGNYAYESIRKEIPVSDEKITVGTQGTNWTVKTDQPGTFFIQVRETNGDLLARVDYSVAGEGNGTQILDKNAELSAKLSKSEYKPDEEIEIQVTAPYTGAGLITIERDKVFAYQWFQAKTTSSVQKIRVPKEMEGNGYVNVSFVRALDSKEIYMSPLSYAVLPFQINREARHTKITIDAPKLVLPGEPLHINVTADRPTKAVVYAVDEGILQVAGYKLPDPLDFFFQKQALEVGTRQTVDLILPEYSIAREVAAAGGDEGKDLLAHHLNPFKRKHDAPVVYWSGIVDIGPTATIWTYNVPEYFAGTLRIMVVAATPEAVGSAEQKIQARGPFVISPNVPTFVAPGDTFDVSVTVANNIEGSGASAPVKLKMVTSEGLEIVQTPDETVPISEGHDASVHWLIRAKNLLGNADLNVVAQFQGKTGHLMSHLSIRPPVPYLTTVTSGYFSSTQKQVDLPNKMYPQFMEGHAMASILPQGLSRGLGTYLEHYEWGCTEQLVSKAFPSLVSEDTQSQGLLHEDVQKHLNDAFAVAATRQNDEGAIGLWYAAPNLQFDLPSVWVVHLLTEAKERGYEIPESLLTRALGHLEKVAEGTPRNFYDARVQAYAIYLLTRNGQVTTNYLEHTREWFEKNSKDWEEDISGPLLASSYALLKNESKGDDLMSKFHLIGARVQYQYDFYNGLARDGLVLDLMAHHFPQRLNRLTPEDLEAMVKPIMDGEFNTLSAAHAILGLDSYARAVGKNSSLPTIQIDEMVGEKDALKPQALTLTSGLYPSGKFSPEASAILFHKPDTSGIGLPGLFYQVTQSGFSSVPVIKPINEGIEVVREYRDAGDHVVTSAHLGDELTVHIVVRGVGYRDLSNVAILDLLPGGFEVESEWIHSGRCSYGGINYADVREDRVALFGSVFEDETTITYKIKATNKGTYVIPPPQAESMYNLKIRSRGVTSSMTVE